MRPFLLSDGNSDCYDLKQVYIQEHCKLFTRLYFSKAKWLQRLNYLKRLNRAAFVQNANKDRPSSEFRKHTLCSTFAFIIIIIITIIILFIYLLFSTNISYRHSVSFQNLSATRTVL